MENNITLNNVQEESWRIEQFVEEIADKYNIFSSYYSNILVSLVETLNKSRHEDYVNISFQSGRNGLMFNIHGLFDKEEDYKNLSYLISLLCDDYKIESDYIQLVFSINSINSELSAYRKNAFHKYLKGEEIEDKNS